jgi:tetratricopeptide (TPR) repeat protein
VWPADTAAEALIEGGHWKQARSIVEARIRAAPDDPLANFLLSQIRNAFGDRSAPLPLAEKAVALAPGTAKYHRQLAEVLGVTAQHANAFQQLLLARRFRKEIESALALDPLDTQALRDLVEFYLLAPGIAGGDQRKAAATAGRIAALDAAEGFLAQARVAEFQKRTTDAAVLLGKGARAEPPSYRALLALAEFHLDSNHADTSAAEAAARKAIALHPDRSAAYTVLARIYASRSAWSELDSLLTEAARQSPDDLAPYYRAAERLAAMRREPERAERYLRSYLSQEPEGNEPTAADAAQLQKRLHVAAAAPFHRDFSKM